jgi:hypothetical protein
MMDQNQNHGMVTIPSRLDNPTDTDPVLVIP